MELLTCIHVTLLTYSLLSFDRVMSALEDRGHYPSKAEIEEMVEAMKERKLGNISLYANSLQKLIEDSIGVEVDLWKRAKKFYKLQ